jgi:hypothetical protein
MSIEAEHRSIWLPDFEWLASRVRDGTSPTVSFTGCKVAGPRRKPLAGLELRLELHLQAHRRRRGSTCRVSVLLIESRCQEHYSTSAWMLLEKMEPHKVPPFNKFIKSNHLDIFGRFG